MDKLFDSMYQAAEPARNHFESDPIKLHELFYGLGGCFAMLRRCGVWTELGNLSCDTDEHFRKYYDSLPGGTSIKCPADVTTVTKSDPETVQDADGSFLLSVTHNAHKQNQNWQRADTSHTHTHTHAASPM